MFPLFSKTLFRVLLIAAPICLIAQSNEDNPWIFKNNKDNVKVFYRKTEDIHEIKLVASIKTSLSGLMQLFVDVDTYNSWSYKLMESKYVKKISETEFIYYSRFDFPWPLSDRDVIMHASFEQDPATKKITVNSYAEPDALPEVKDVVRMRKAKTQWTVWPGNDGWAYTEYYIYSDPGGSIPDWVINMGLDLGPRETVKSMRKELKKPQYQQAKIDFVVD